MGRYAQGRAEVLLGKKFLSVLVPAGLAVLMILADGCGAYNPNGTGGGGTGGSNPGQAQGFYSCDLQSVTAPTMETLILSTDVFYGMVGQLQQSSFAVSGLITGQGASGNDTYTSTALTEYSSSGGSSPVTVSVTDVPQSSMSGTITIGGAQAGFGGAALAGSLYTYSNPASIATIATTTTPWTGTLLDGTAVTLNISTAGVITTASAGCTISGNLTANTSNNLYTVTNLSFGSCTFNSALSGSQTSSAVGISFFLPDGVTQELLIPATVTAGGVTVGTVFSAHK